MLDDSDTSEHLSQIIRGLTVFVWHLFISKNLGDQRHRRARNRSDPSKRPPRAPLLIHLAAKVKPYHDVSSTRAPESETGGGGSSCHNDSASQIPALESHLARAQRVATPGADIWVRKGRGYGVRRECGQFLREGRVEG